MSGEGREVDVDQAMELFAPGKTPAETFLERRLEMIAFVKDHLVEATYKSDGYVKKENDYYKVPKSDSYAFTRRGASKLGDRYDVKQLDEHTDDHIYTPEHVMYRIRVTVGRDTRVLGVAAGSCSTSESRFTSQGTKKLYGATYQDGQEVEPPDYRAADHDVLAMAKKRGYVSAIVDALCAHDVLRSAVHGPTVDQLKRAILLLSHESVSDEKRMKWAEWTRKPSCTAEKMEEQLASLEDHIHETVKTEERQA